MYLINYQSSEKIFSSVSPLSACLKLYPACRVSISRTIDHIFTFINRARFFRIECKNHSHRKFEYQIDQNKVRFILQIQWDGG